MSLFRNLYLVFLFIGLLVAFQSKAQSTDSIRITDSTPMPESYIKAKQRIGNLLAAKSISQFQTDLIATKQNELIELLKKKTQKAKEYIKSGIDTMDILYEFRKIESKLDISGEGIFTHKGTTLTYRNLSTTYKIIHELLSRANAQKSKLDNYQMKLDNFRYEIDSLSSNPALYVIPDDSIAIATYLEKVSTLVDATRPIDSMLKSAITNVHRLQRQANYDVNKLEANQDEVEHYLSVLSQRMFNREFDNFGGQIGRKRPLKDILYISIVKAQITLWFYAENNWGLLLLTISIIISLTLFLRKLRRLMGEANLLHPTFLGQLTLRYPLLSSLIIVLNLAQFIFPTPPFIFSGIFWVISAIALTFISKGLLQPFWHRTWQILFLLFLFACINNLILLASSIERTGMALLALVGIIFGTIIIVKSKHHLPKEKLIYFFVGLLLFLELMSLIANILGQYNLSKTLLTGGYFNFMIGFMFIWTAKLTDQILAIAYKFYIGQERKLFYINFERLGEKTPLIVYILLIFGWFVLVGRNFYEFKLLADPFRSFLYSERTIGDFNYSMSSILVFITILSSSFLLSKIVSFFASDKNYKQGMINKERKAGAGSWLLLIRVAILVLGVFLAFAAAGLPMERITLILGALGVGIGFGLQTLVNNLVSGLIIAFEKPVNLGDIVEINGQSGIVKSIGFRSSIISRWEGADLIIPNGDLLNAHLINWTLGGGKMRVDLLLAVSSHEDLENIRTILNKALSKIDTVLQFPAPTIYFNAFNNSSIDIRISFWVSDVKESNSIKSTVIDAVQHSFKEHGIAISIPQQALYISVNKDLEQEHTADQNDNDIDTPV